MEKPQLKTAIKRIKEKSVEERQKIKKIIIKRRDDFLTALEKNWRDWAFRPLTFVFGKIGISANHVTYTGFLFLAVAVWLYFKDYNFQWQFFFLILSALTDIIDGPTARNNDNVTILGTWLDHIRDGILVLWATYLIYSFGLLSGQVIFIIWTLQFLIIWISVKDFLIRYLEDLPTEESEALIHKFSLDNLQASIIGRLQFLCWTTGYGLLLSFALMPYEWLITAGSGLIVLEIIFASLNILESYQKTL